MQVVLTTPANLVNQQAGQLFDPGLAGLARGAGPSGPLGATITLPIGFQSQAIDMGFVPSSYIYG
jgi:hypothetical protein